MVVFFGMVGVLIYKYIVLECEMMYNIPGICFCFIISLWY